MATDSVFLPRYAQSWALVIGIDAYSAVSPLAYAANDARAVANYLTSKLNFIPSNVKLLLDSDASRNSIMKEFLSFTGEQVTPNDRVVVFFAGHGLTRPARRGEIGYLVPSDGTPTDLSTLIRWDDLTRNAELISAKHVLFVMDACYGGLALTRSVPAGSLRFLKDMLSRYSRQVLTAGKGDEAVADSGGPRAGHSLFTGHFLDAVEGAAASPEGIITANAVMNYVYQQVSKDPYSNQTPHYGMIDGDGDFIFAAPELPGLQDGATIDHDILVDAPHIETIDPEGGEPDGFATIIKEYLSDPRFRIKLDDLVTMELRTVLQTTDAQRFPISTPTITPTDIAERLRRYERVIDRFAHLIALISHWGEAEHRALLGRTAARLVENNSTEGGQGVWLGLRWYPAEFVLYVGGMAALSGENYANFAALLNAKTAPRISGHPPRPLVFAVVSGLSDAVSAGAFKVLPGYERFYAPQSEYLFKTVQPILEDLLFLGRGYESIFDRHEILTALVYADQKFDLTKGTSIWGPPGRFAWKAMRGGAEDPFAELVEEAKRMGDDWGPLKAGLFRGSLARFVQVAEHYYSFMQQLGWH